MNFRRMLFTILVVISLVPSVFIGLFAIKENDMIIENMVRENLESVCKLQISEIKSFCEMHKVNMERFSEYDIIRATVQDSLKDGGVNQNEESIKYINNMLEAYKKSDNSVYSISVINSDFKNVASSETYVLNSDSFLKGAAAENLSGKFRIGNIHERQTFHGTEKFVAAFIGIYDGDKIIGYLVEEISIDYFNVFRLDDKFINGRTVYITDKFGKMISAGTSEQKQGLTEYVTTPQERQEYIDQWESIDFEKQPFGIIDYNALGTKYITCYSTLPNTDWIVRVSANLDSYQLQTLRFKYALGYAFAIIGILIMIASVLISRAISTPVRKILNVLSNVRNNHDYSLRIKLNRQDDFGILAEQIDELIFSLEEKYHEDERQKRLLQRKIDKDPLTDTYSRAAITEKLTALISSSAANDSVVKVGFVDIDDFREFNNIHGHHIGDEVLCFVAEAIKDVFGENVGRNGGDEFLFWSVADDNENIEDKLKNLIVRLNGGFFSKDTNKHFSITCSIGVAFANAAPADITKLIKKADFAMYKAKEAGKNGYHLEY